jgi:iron(II)-dependent oxidoreductase
MPLDAPSGRSADAPVGDLERRVLAGDLRACRAATLALFRRVDPALFRRQLHPNYSPLGWHLGHIAFTEALWLLAGEATSPEFARAFAVDGLAKAERGAIPEPEAIFDYVARVRQALLVRLADPSAVIDAALWRFVIQQAQHAETATFVHALAAPHSEPFDIAPDARPLDYVTVPGGRAEIGDDGAAALDNEREKHAMDVRAFALARHPVTQAEFAAFMAAGGYRRRELWTGEGWSWREAHAIEHPQHWTRNAPDHPVTG